MRLNLAAILRGAGTALAWGGGLCLVASGLLPWARFPLLGFLVELPGVVLGGAGTAVPLLGALAIAGGRWRRGGPVVLIGAGIAAFVLGVQAPRLVGRAVTARVLAAQGAVAPLNARLAQAALPPLEPFGVGIAPRAAYVGPGPGWALWGGGLVALGGTVRFAGLRRGRTCRACRRTWREAREGVHFCPHCGAGQAGAETICRECGDARDARDTFCARCGAPAKKNPASLVA